MNLRTQLSLFFGGLLVLLLSVVVYFNYQRLYGTLETSLKAQFSLAPYLQLAEVERSLLLERANALVDRPPVLAGVRRIITLLEDPEKGLNAVEAVRGQPDSDDFVLLYSTYEQMLQVLSRTEDADGQDLVLLASYDGTVIAETFNQSLSTVDQNQALNVSVKSVADESLWPVMLSLDSSKGYLVYPNDKLYLYGFASFKSHVAFQGVAVVGKEIDRDFLKQITQNDATDSETHAVVLYGGHMVASSDDAEKLGLALKGQDLGVTWTSPAGQTFLVKSADLSSYYLSPEEEEQFGAELEVSTETVAKVYLLQDVSGIQKAAFDRAKETLLLGFLALVLALFAVPLVARRFTGPVGELSDAMKAVGEGELQPLPEAQLSSITEIKDAALSFNQMVIGLRQKKVLEHFVPEGTRKEVERLQGRTSELGGKRWERTIMFSDLRGFTSMSESMSPDEVMGVLNKYLHVMSKAIRLEGGDINEYIGDAILAVFESPDAAVRASLAMTRELVELRKDKSIEALAGLAQGIGLHTGPLVEGNIGEENRRLKRAVVGDTVNLAARIQDRSRDGSHSHIFISGDTKDKLKEPVELVHFGDEMFKGKAEPIPVWEIKLSEPEPE